MNPEDHRVLSRAVATVFARTRISNWLTRMMQRGSDGVHHPARGAYTKRRPRGNPRRSGQRVLAGHSGVAVLIDAPPHHPHVLLRHRLLRQLRGFQGIGWLVKEGLEAKHLTIADLKENPDRLIERNPAPPAAETDMAQRGDAISRVAPILDHQVPLVELAKAPWEYRLGV